MKKYLFLLLIPCCFENLFSQVCEPNGVSTNPDSPSNTNAPSAHPEHWLNSFSWFNHDGFSLTQYALHDMLAYSPDQFMMMHPYSDQNSGHQELTEPVLLELDMYPEQGWEMLSVNLGSYPNGELLSAQIPAEQSALGEIPYLLLYNKNRGIIRLFAN